MKKSNLGWGIFALCGAGLGFLAYGIYRRFYAARAIAASLPIEQSGITITDRAGHYDLDGVSFDATGVVVASDASTAAIEV